MFPFISHINDLLPHIANKPEINVKLHENGCTVVCYSITGPNTFDDEWSRECRGITFGPDGKILARSLHKFFNLGEKEHTQRHTLDFSKENVSRVMDKRDGSMITAMVLNGEIICKTKKSFDTAEARMALDYIKANPAYEVFIRAMAKFGATPTFELTSPANRIVLKYDEVKLTLLHVRMNESGHYVANIIPLLAGLNLYRLIDVVDEFIDKDSVERVLDLYEAEENKEGYIIQFVNGEMVKMKTKWYLDLHHSVTFTRERDIANMVINETLDDYRSYLSQIGESHDKVDAVEARVLKTLLDLQTEVEAYVAEHFTDNRKAFAIKAKEHKLFGLIMAKYSGKDPDYAKHFNEFFLRDYSLEVL